MSSTMHSRGSPPEAERVGKRTVAHDPHRWSRSTIAGLRRLGGRRRDPEHPVVGTSFDEFSAFTDQLVNADISARCNTFSIACRLLRDRADLVLGGDFNVAVGYRQPREEIRFSRGEREVLDRLAEEFDLVSCWQAANPDRPLAQTLRWMGNPSAPYHCDGIFVPRRGCRDWSPAA